MIYYTCELFRINVPKYTICHIYSGCHFRNRWLVISPITGVGVRKGIWGERVLVGGYLNGHVCVCREAIERIHDGWRVGMKKKERRMRQGNICCDDILFINRFFVEKETNH